MTNNIIYSIPNIKNRIKQAINDFEIYDLIDYTIDSTIGCDINNFYNSIIIQTLNKDIYVHASELSDGKYIVYFEFDNDNIYNIKSYAWNTPKDIINNLLEYVIIPYLESYYLIN